MHVNSVEAYVLAAAQMQPFQALNAPACSLPAIRVVFDGHT